MPFCRGNSSYSTDWKGGLLLLTTWVGRPYLAKIWRMALIFESAVVVFMEPITSGHLEWAWPFYYFAWWVAKSTWTRCHGAVGQDHGRSGEAGGALRVLLHGWHSRVTFSISWSIFGHQTWLRAIDFMRAIPGWPSCNSVRMVCLKEGGMTVRKPHIRQPCSTESSCLRVKYGLRSGSAPRLIGQPFCVSNSAFANKGFLDVSLAISAAETGCRFNCWGATWKISSSTLASFLYWSGSLDKASALATSADDLNSIS